ncbi:MAG: TRAP transporter small permease [Rhodospirillaceae bacterium]
MRLLHAIERFHHVLGVLSGLAILVITLTVIIDVALRALFNAPLHGATEFSTLLMIGLVYLGLASVQASKANFRVEVLLMLLPAGGRRFLDAVTTLLAAAAIGVLTWHTAHEAWASVLRQEMSFGAVVFPVWPARVVIAMGLLMLLLQFVIDTIRLVAGGDTLAAATADEDEYESRRAAE